MPKIDMGQLESKNAATGRNVVIPAEDLYERKFPTIRINHFEFEAGQTYFLDEPIASTVEERIKAYQQYNIKLMSSRPDKKALQQVSGNKSGQYTTDF